MSGNINCANYCDFGANRTSNVRVNQGPGGNSSLSLAWTTNQDPPKQSVVRSNSNSNYSVKENSYGKQGVLTNSKYDNQKYNPITNAPIISQTQKNQVEYYQEDQSLRNNKNANNVNRYDPGDINSFYVQQKKPREWNQETPDQPNQQNNKPPLSSLSSKRNDDRNDYYQQQKTSVQVKQNPGGKSSFQIGGEYNYFKDNENNERLGNKNSNSPTKQDGYQPIRNNYRNMIQNEQGQQQQQQMNYNQEYQQNYIASNNNQMRTNSRQSGQSQIQEFQPKYQQQIGHPSQQSNAPRQSNDLNDIKFGYRVSQPPGGRSSFTFG